MHCECLNELNSLFIEPIAQIIHFYAHDPLAIMDDIPGFLLNVRGWNDMIWMSTRGGFIGTGSGDKYPHCTINISPAVPINSRSRHIGIQFFFMLSICEGFSAKIYVPIDTRDQKLEFLRKCFSPENREPILHNASWSTWDMPRGGQSAVRHSNKWFRIRRLDYRIDAFTNVWNATHRALEDMIHLAQHLPLPLIVDSVQFA